MALDILWRPEDFRCRAQDPTDIRLESSSGGNSGKGETVDPRRPSQTHTGAPAIPLFGNSTLVETKPPAPQIPCPIRWELVAITSAQAGLSHSVLASGLAVASDLTLEARDKPKGCIVLCQKRILLDGLPTSMLFWPPAFIFYAANDHT